ncbi:MAG: hypothetical protein INQ03_04010 [Candidatus Heimdallarchaeota archaeon]|nr:hypothetical protein [Candidatus Heimdallarchaeota archaeon]
MIDYRLYTWQLLNLAVILFYPLLRKVLGWNTTEINKQMFKYLSITVLFSIIIQVSYVFSFIQDTEFIYIQFIIILYYAQTGFMQFTSGIRSLPMKVKRFNEDIVKKIARAYGGKNFETEDGIFKFQIITPYRMQYAVYMDRVKDEGYFNFQSFPSNLRLYKILLLFSYYLSSQALTTTSEDVKIPFFDAQLSAVLSVIVVMSVVVLLAYLETSSLMTFASEFPDFYKKALTKTALSLAGGSSEPNDNTSVINTSKDKAKALLEKRDFNLVQAKKQELQKKVDSVFGTDDKVKSIDPKVIERVRLMNAVKRVLNSTPKWKTVSLAEIAKIVKGDEKEVEIIISGLRDLKEVTGIYDIWEKQYHGDSMGQWLQTQNVIEAINENKLDTVRSVKIYPDGTSELFLKEDEEDNQKNLKKN